MKQITTLDSYEKDNWLLEINGMSRKEIDGLVRHFFKHKPKDVEIVLFKSFVTPKQLFRFNAEKGNLYANK